jgi:hypothetical protein
MFPHVGKLDLSEEKASQWGESDEKGSVMADMTVYGHEVVVNGADYDGGQGGELRQRPTVEMSSVMWISIEIGHRGWQESGSKGGRA